MDTSATPNSTHQILSRTFAELGATGSVVRSVLLKDRYFFGQKFRCGDFQAVLLAGKDEIEFYDQSGELLKTVRLEETDKKVAA